MESPRKERLSVYLDPAIMNRLAEHAARRDHSRSLVAEAAIESFLSPDAAERQEAVVAKRLDQLDPRLTRLERDMGISIEMLAVFVRFWLATTPALPEPAAQAPRAPRPGNATTPSLQPLAVVSPRGQSCVRRLPRTSPRRVCRIDRSTGYSQNPFSRRSSRGPVVRYVDFNHLSREGGR